MFVHKEITTYYKGLSLMIVKDKVLNSRNGNTNDAFDSFLSSDQLTQDIMLKI